MTCRSHSDGAGNGPTETDADSEDASIRIQQHPTVYSSGRQKGRISLEITYALPIDEEQVGSIARSIVKPILQHLQWQHYGNLMQEPQISNQESGECNNDQMTRTVPDQNRAVNQQPRSFIAVNAGHAVDRRLSQSFVKRRRNATAITAGLTAGVLELSRSIADTIIQGGHVLRSDTDGGLGWLQDLRKLGSNMTLDQLYTTHSRIAGGTFRQSKQSSFIRCLLMVIISKRTGRPSSAGKPLATSQPSAKDERLRRYLASTGRLFVDLINHISRTHRSKAYNLCAALIAAPANGFSFSTPELRRLQGSHAREIIATVSTILENSSDKAWLETSLEATFDPARAVTAADLSYEGARQKLGLTAPSLAELWPPDVVTDDQNQISLDDASLPGGCLSDDHDMSVSDVAFTTINPAMLTAMSAANEKLLGLFPDQVQGQDLERSHPGASHPHFTPRAPRALPRPQEVMLFESEKEPAYSLGSGRLDQHFN